MTAQLSPVSFIDALNNRPDTDNRVLRSHGETYYNVGGSTHGGYYAHKLKSRNGHWFWMTDYTVSQDFLEALMNAPEGLHSRSHDDDAPAGIYAVNCGGLYVTSISFHDVHVTTDIAKCARFETKEGADAMVRGCLSRNAPNARVVELSA